jgi:N-acetylmuramoyl-L-alanine amidase
MNDKNNFRALGVLILIGAIVFTGWSCSRDPYAASNKQYRKRTKELTALLQQYPLSDSGFDNSHWIGTTNFDLRKPNFVILHHTAQNSCELTLKTFTTDKSKVSAHYLICKDGSVHHLLNDYMRAWQAGISKWGNATDINSLSIGIELDNNGFEPFSTEQINSLMDVLTMLKKKYNIPAANFIGHSDVAPGRKVDPNRYFPWEPLADKGFGLWFDTTCIVAPDNFDTLQALRIIGYDLKNPKAAVQSFKLHFVQGDSLDFLTESDKKILYVLSQKYQ